MAAALAAALSLAVSPAHAATCARPGGGGGCKATIQEAVDAAGPGETVFVHPGRYTGGVTIPGGKDGLVVVGTGKSPSAAHLDLSGKGMVGFFVQAAGVRVSNLTVRGALTGLLSNQSGTKVTRFVVLGADQEGVNITGDNALVSASRFTGAQTGVLIHGNGALVRGVKAAMSWSGITIFGDRGRVIGSRVSNFAGSGIYVIGPGGVVRDCRVQTFAGLGIGISSTTTTEVARAVRNRVAGGGGTGILFSSQGPGLVAGNAVTQISGTGVQADCGADCSSFRVGANVVDDTILGPGFMVTTSVPGAVVAGNLSTGNGAQGFAIDAPGASVHHNVAAGNCLHGPSHCAGIGVAGSADVLLRNVSRGNGMAGFDVAGTGMTLSHNRAEGNLHHGFVVAESGPASGTVLDANRAVNNVDYGFFLTLTPSGTSLTNNVALRSSYSPYCNNSGLPATLTGNNFTAADNLCMP